MGSTVPVPPCCGATPCFDPPVRDGARRRLLLIFGGASRYPQCSGSCRCQRLWISIVLPFGRYNRRQRITIRSHGAGSGRNAAPRSEITSKGMEAGGGSRASVEWVSSRVRAGCRRDDRRGPWAARLIRPRKGQTRIPPTLEFPLRHREVFSLPVWRVRLADGWRQEAVGTLSASDARYGQLTRRAG